MAERFWTTKPLEIVVQREDSRIPDWWESLPACRSAFICQLSTIWQTTCTHSSNVSSESLNEEKLQIIFGTDFIEEIRRINEKLAQIPATTVDQKDNQSKIVKFRLDWYPHSESPDYPCCWDQNKKTAKDTNLMTSCY